MPTNFNRSIRQKVPLKKNETCNLRRHLLNILREVYGYLILLDSVKQSGFAFCCVPAITKECNKFRKGKEPYKQRQVEYALRFLRELGLITFTFENEDGHFGFIVARQDVHDALCRREKNCCIFVGWNNVPPAGIEVGKTYPDSVFFASPKMPDKSPVNASPGAVSGAVSSAKGAVSGAVFDEKRCGIGCGTDSPQATDNAALAASPEKFSRKFAALNHENLVSQPRETGEPTPTAKATATDTSFFPLTDQNLSAMGNAENPNGDTLDENKIAAIEDKGNPNPAPAPQTLPGAPPAPTAAEYLRRGEHAGRGVLDLITDNLLDRQNSACKRFAHWRELEADCREAFRLHAREPITDRKVLATLMDEAARLAGARREHGFYSKNCYPRPWLRVRTELLKGGDVYAPPAVPEEKVRIPTVFLMGAAPDIPEADLAPFLDDLHAYGHGGAGRGFDDAAAHIDAILAKRTDRPEVLTRLRDNMLARACQPIYFTKGQEAK